MTEGIDRDALMKKMGMLSEIYDKMTFYNRLRHCMFLFALAAFLAAIFVQDGLFTLSVPIWIMGGGWWFYMSKHYDKWAEKYERWAIMNHKKE